MRNGKEMTHRTRGGADGGIQQLLDDKLHATGTFDPLKVRVLFRPLLFARTVGATHALASSNLSTRDVSTSVHRSRAHVDPLLPHESSLFSPAPSITSIRRVDSPLVARGVDKRRHRLSRLADDLGSDTDEKTSLRLHSKAGDRIRTTLAKGWRWKPGLRKLRREMCLARRFPRPGMIRQDVVLVRMCTGEDTSQNRGSGGSIAGEFILCVDADSEGFNFPNESVSSSCTEQKHSNESLGTKILDEVPCLLEKGPALVVLVGRNILLSDLFFVVHR